MRKRDVFPLKARWILVILLCARHALGKDEVDIASARLQPMEGRVLYFRSRIYGDSQPLAVCATGVSETPRPLVVDLIPGTLSQLEGAARACEEICKIARGHGLECVALRPCGRGNGSIYQGYGEVDVYEAIDAVRKLAAVDPERITVSGVSMGGAATWYHASHYPDFWAAAAPFCGYCDYKLWEKPGGTTFHRQAWEEFSWISRDAAYRVENVRHLPLRITHGEWDRAVGGGVPVEHSRRMHTKLAELGYLHEYIEVPKTGHGCRLPALWEETVVWLLGQRRAANPEQVSLVVHTLRHNRAHWVAVEEQSAYGKVSRVEARFDKKGNRVVVTTENVRRLALGPLPDAGAVTVQIDGASLPPQSLSATARFARGETGSWTRVEEGIRRGEKRPGLSGPFGDLFFEPIIIVYGASGSETETEFNRLMAGNAVRFYNQQNGGVHRGGINGDNVVSIPVMSDREVLEVPAPAPGAPSPAPKVEKELLERANLFLIGNEKSNAVLARLAADLPFRFEAGTLHLAGKTYSGAHLAFYAVLPHPDGRRYVALLSGSEPDAITWGSHVGLQLLPDYFVFNHDEVVDWGFWNNRWRAAE